MWDGAQEPHFCLAAQSATALWLWGTNLGQRLWSLGWRTLLPTPAASWLESCPVITRSEESGHLVTLGHRSLPEAGVGTGGWSCGRRGQEGMAAEPSALRGWTQQPGILVSCLAWHRPRSPPLLPPPQDLLPPLRHRAVGAGGGRGVTAPAPWAWKAGVRSQPAAPCSLALQGEGRSGWAET